MLGIKTAATNVNIFNICTLINISFTELKFLAQINKINMSNEKINAILIFFIFPVALLIHTVIIDIIRKTDDVDKLRYKLSIPFIVPNFADFDNVKN